ncbi:putative nuclear RNA export factor SDE5 isoform X3 [Nicotiana tabacum]|uniref:Nuclear RNA export factor SDE5 isoform X3 n=1 Tax=Nicotiana tabacum TaxID=4097 RepID=A0AC58S2T4_TOBAC
MKMEAPPTVLFTDDDRKNLEQLLDVFGRVVSLDDIAAAYCKAGRDPIIAGDILGDLQASTSITTTSASEEKIEDSLTLTSESEFEEVGDSVTLTSESASDIHAKRAGPSSSKQKKLSVSMGTVSSMIPRDYVTNRPLIPETSTRIKPLKLSVDDFFTSEIRDEKAPLGAAAMSETLPGSVEEFLFKMLGDRFSLDMSVIEDVVGQCGYDLNKSMDKLLDLSASTLGKRDDILDIGVQKSVESPDFASVASHETPSMQDPTSRSKAKNMTKNGFNLSKKEKDRYELQKEVLQTLFNVPARHDGVDDVIRHVREVEKSRRLSQFVVKPSQETVERQILIRTPQSDAKNGEENEESYEVLRKAVKEYWITMKEYYKAAAEAFQKGDQVKAHRFLEEGNFFMTKARETDEQSTQKLLENSYSKEIVTVDLHDFEPKEAVRYLKFQLTSLCGISSIQYLKIIVGITNEEAKDTQTFGEGLDSMDGRR